jgi:hypothetical protein
MVKTIEKVSLLKNKLKHKIIHKSKNKKNKNKEPKEQKEPVLRQEPISEHFFTFQLPSDVYTLLYTSIVFKWIQTERVNKLNPGPYTSR